MGRLTRVGMETLMLENISDQDLLRRARAGDRDACEALIQGYQGRLKSRLRPRIGAGLRQKLNLEDVVQETLSNALVSLKTFEYRGEGSFLGWLCSIGERVILKAAESDRRKPLLTLRHEIEARQTSPSKGMRQEERFDRLKGAIQNLGPDQREVVMLARVECMPIKEIASRTGKSPAAVSMLLSRALTKLRETFGDTESLSLPDRRFDSGENESEAHGE